MWTQNICSVFALKVAFSNLSGIVWTRPKFKTDTSIADQVATRNVSCVHTNLVSRPEVYLGAAERSKKWGAEAGGRDECGGGGGRVGVFDKEYQSAPVNCKADRLSAFCASRAKMSAIRTRHDKTTLLVTKGGNGHFRTLRAITYKKILNKSNAILAACLHLLATFGLECRVFACKKNTICKKVGGGGGCPPIF